MGEILGFILIVIGIMFSVFISSYIFFKKSVVLVMELIATNIAGMTAIMAYIIALKGLGQLLWVVPTIAAVSVFNFSMMQKHLSKPIISLKNDIVGKLSNGELDFNFDENILAKGNEFGEIARALSRMRKQLMLIVGEIQKISKTIDFSSLQQSESAILISTGANEQASSTEEISATLEEISATNHQNAANAKQTADLSKSAATNMDGMEVLIETTVKSISNIIEKIQIVNDIAYQTNILALNASVEAARAGEAGRGFAVVANEVRSLAENSKMAADEIKELSNLTVKQTHESEAFVKQLVQEIEKTSNLVENISIASIEQSAGTDQISTAIQNLNQVSQQNAAAAEELAASSEELSSQSKNLIEAIQFFKTGSDV